MEVSKGNHDPRNRSYGRRYRRKAKGGGTRVSARQIYEMHVLVGMPVEEIAHQLRTVSEEGVETAIEWMEEREGGEVSVERTSQ